MHIERRHGLDAHQVLLDTVAFLVAFTGRRRCCTAPASIVAVDPLVVVADQTVRLVVAVDGCVALREDARSQNGHMRFSTTADIADDYQSDGPCVSVRLSKKNGALFG